MEGKSEIGEGEGEWGRNGWRGMGCCVSTPIKEEQRSSGVKRDDRATNGDHGTSESANVGDRGDKSSSVDDNGVWWRSGVKRGISSVCGPFMWVEITRWSLLFPVVDECVG